MLRREFYGMVDVVAVLVYYGVVVLVPPVVVNASGAVGVACATSSSFSRKGTGPHAVSSGTSRRFQSIEDGPFTAYGKNFDAAR